MERRPYPEFGKKYMVGNLFLFIPLAGLFYLMWRRWGNFDPVFFLLLVLFAVGVILGLVWNRRRLKRFRCPRYGLSIPAPVIEERTCGEPIDYHCPACDIAWETGLREGGVE